MTLIFLGDVVGKGGRAAVKQLLPELREEFKSSFAVINGENSAAGCGLTAGCAEELLAAGAQVITSGDHIWDQKGFETEILRSPNVLRPANLAACQPGRGYGVFAHPVAGNVAVISLLGKVFMRESAYCPFETVDRILKELPVSVRTIVVDFHAEATSEKLAMASYLDGRVTAVFGTHTHVQTADAVILPGGTAAITDAGMCGAAASILGREIPAVLRKFTSGMPVRLPVVEHGLIRVDGAAVEYDYETGRAKKITSFSRFAEIA